MTLLGAAQIRELAAALDLKPSKSLGQNFVIDSNVCTKIVRTAAVGPTDVALEIDDQIIKLRRSKRFKVNAYENRPLYNYQTILDFERKRVVVQHVMDVSKLTGCKK